MENNNERVAKLKECRLCHKRAEIFYIPGCTVLRCKCKKLVTPDGGTPEYFDELTQKWNNEWYEQTKIQT